MYKKKNHKTIKQSNNLLQFYNKTNRSYAPADDEGFITPGAKISLYDDGTGELVATAISDNNGLYEFTNLSEGYYSLEYEYGTYAVGEESVHLLESVAIDHIFVPDISRL